MKKGMLLLTLAVMLFSSLPIVALAANQTDMSTVLTYTKDAPETSSPEPEPPPTATYEISIPASISLNDELEFYITSNNMNLNDGQEVVVYIDSKSYDDSYICLRNSGPDEIHAEIRRWNAEAGFFSIVGKGSVIARFNNNSASQVPVGLFLFAGDLEEAQSGEYTGTIYFKIGIENN